MRKQLTSLFLLVIKFLEKYICFLLQKFISEYVGSNWISYFCLVEAEKFHIFSLFLRWKQNNFIFFEWKQNNLTFLNDGSRIISNILLKQIVFFGLVEVG